MQYTTARTIKGANFAAGACGWGYNEPMSKAEIIAELTRLPHHDLLEIREKLNQLVGDEWSADADLSAGDKAALNRAIDDYRRDPGAGTDWPEVRERALSALRGDQS